MAIQFTQQKKKQKILIIAFGIVLLVTSVVVWYGFFRDDTPSFVPSPTVTAPAPREISINFSLLESLAFQELRPFERISPYEEGTGRRNPFLPYGGTNIAEGTIDFEGEEETEPEI